MRKSIIIGLVIVISGVILVPLVLGAYYYRGFGSSLPAKVPGYEGVVVPSAPSGEFADNYTSGEGVILIDLAHSNGFSLKELNVLMLRLVSRGLVIRFLEVGDDLEKELVGEKEDEEPAGEQEVAVKEKEEPEKLPSAFIIISPRREFSKDEKKAIKQFVDDGGKLLLIADPSRRDQINNVSLEFGLIFEADYLYNQKENEINYQNIFISDFKENEITRALEKIALYTTGSISSANGSLAFVDSNTLSNLIETRDRLSPMALAQESKVLAVYDLTFMTEPYNGTLDNNQLIANIADWLMSPGEKKKSK